MPCFVPAFFANVCSHCSVQVKFFVYSRFQSEWFTGARLQDFSAATIFRRKFVVAASFSRHFVTPPLISCISNDIITSQTLPLVRNISKLAHKIRIPEGCEEE
jgi:hypothetical protein